MVEFEQVRSHLGIEKGAVAIIGGGGKTTLLMTLANRLRAYGSVLVATSTHIFPPNGIPLRTSIEAPLKTGECVAVGTMTESQKLTAPKQEFDILEAFSDYLLIEADGARGLPLKAHAGYEPVIPKACGCVIAVVGMTGIGKPIRDTAHRPALYAKLLGVEEDTIVTPSHAAAVVRTYPRVTGVVLNQADTEKQRILAREAAKQLPFPVVIASLRANDPFFELWRNGTCWLS